MMLLKTIILMVVATFCSAGVPKIVRPCYLNDKKCIASNIAANSACKRPSRAVPSEYVIPTFRYETPYFNSSYIDHNLIIRNHHRCFISEFYYNIVSDTAVLSIDCPRLNLKSNRTLIQHHSYREDSQYSYQINGTYPLIRLTTTLHPAYRMDLCTAFTFADVTQLPVFHINPNDRPTANFLSKDLTPLKIYERETFWYRAKSLARFYINRVLCDFGCDQ